MKKCSRCENMIPEGMKLCPHCCPVPPKLPSKFGLYCVLCLVALFCAFWFRPFAGGTVISQADTVVLWAAFVIFTLFGLFFAFIAYAIKKDYLSHGFGLTKAERTRFIKMKQHIESGHHHYEGSKYCSICGHKR